MITMKKLKGLIIILAIILTASSCEDKYSSYDDGIYAEIETTKGTMFAQLYYEATPVTVANFVALAEGNHEYVLDSLKGKASSGRGVSLDRFPGLQVFTSRRN